MRTIAVVSDTGGAFSARIADLIRAELAPRSADIRILHATALDLLSPAFAADLIVTTVETPASLGIPVVSGMPLLLGTNPAPVFADIVRLLELPPPPGTPET